jgi:hypothetical protein
MAGMTNGTTNREVNGATTNRTALKAAVNGTMESTVANGVKKAAKLAEDEEEVPGLDSIEDTVEAFSTPNPFHATFPLLYRDRRTTKKAPSKRFHILSNKD